MGKLRRGGYVFISWKSDHPYRNGELVVSEEPGLGVELNEQAIAEHPYVASAFPGLWDERWVTKFSPARQ